MPVPRLFEDLIKNNLYFNTQLKIILEQYGLYHSESGNRIHELLKQGIIKENKIAIIGQEHPYVYDRDVTVSELNKLLREKSQLYEEYLKFIQNNPASGFFAECIVFLGLCKAFNAHRDSFSIHLLQPEIRWMNGKGYKIDFPLTIEGEIFAIEVKNNSPHMSPVSKDIQNLLQLSPPVNPVLINRQSTGGLKSEIIRRNGRIADLTKLLLLGSEITNKGVDALRDLEISHIACILPPIDINGELLDGQEFKARILDYTMEELLKASEQVPDNIQRKINGLVRMLYLAMKYRRASHYPKGERAFQMNLALLAQNGYSYLLRAEGQKRGISELFNYASQKISGALQIHFSKERTRLRLAFADLIEYLHEQKMLERFRGKCWINDATTPENWLSLDP